METKKQEYTPRVFWQNRFVNFRLGTIFLTSSWIASVVVLFVEDYTLVAGLLFVIVFPLVMGGFCYYQLIVNRLRLKRNEKVLKNPTWSFFIHAGVLECVSGLGLTTVMIIVGVLDGGIANWIVMAIALLTSVAIFSAIMSFFKFYRLSGGNRFRRSKK